MKDDKVCVICGGDIDQTVDPETGEIIGVYGHNAAPVQDGICCDACNSTVVIPFRLE